MQHRRVPVVLVPVEHDGAGAQANVAFGARLVLAHLARLSSLTHLNLASNGADCEDVPHAHARARMYQYSMRKCTYMDMHSCVHARRPSIGAYTDVDMHLSTVVLFFSSLNCIEPHPRAPRRAGQSSAGADASEDRAAASASKVRVSAYDDE